MAGLQQMQVRYDETEDRILFRLNTTADEEFRFWLTRRFVSRLVPALEQVIAQAPEVKTQASPAAQQAVMEFKQTEVKQKANYDTTFKANPKSFPLGEKPLLAGKAKLSPQSGESYTFSLNTNDNLGIDFALNRNIIRLLHSMLQDVAPKTQWNQQLEAFGSPHDAVEVIASGNAHNTQLN